MEQKLYYNGTILTMADDEGIVEAVLTEDDTILYAGSLEMAKSLASAAVETVDLCQRTMLPGFIDGHSHITAFASTLALVNLNGAKSFDDILRCV